MTKVNIHENTSTVIEDKSTARQVLSGVKGGVVAGGLTGAAVTAAITAADFVPGVDGVATAIAETVGEVVQDTAEYAASFATGVAPVETTEAVTTLTEPQLDYQEATNAVKVGGAAALTAGGATAAYKGGEKWTRKVKSNEVVTPSIG